MVAFGAASELVPPLRTVAFRARSAGIVAEPRRCLLRYSRADPVNCASRAGVLVLLARCFDLKQVREPEWKRGEPYSLKRRCPRRDCYASISCEPRRRCTCPAGAARKIVRGHVAAEARLHLIMRRGLETVARRCAARVRAAAPRPFRPRTRRSFSACHPFPAFHPFRPSHPVLVQARTLYSSLSNRRRRLSHGAGRSCTRRRALVRPGRRLRKIDHRYPRQYHLDVSCSCTCTRGFEEQAPHVQHHPRAHHHA